jgi:hypothetical protein
VIENMDYEMKQNILKFYIDLKNRRAYYLMDLVVLSQCVFLLIITILTPSIVMLDVAEIITDFWYSYLIMFPIIVISITIVKKKILGPRKSWQGSLKPNILLWSFLTVSLGAILDKIFGFGTVFWDSIFKYLLGMWIIIFFCWIFLKILIPPVFDHGGKKSIPGGSGSGAHYSNRCSREILCDELEKSNQEWISYSIPTVHIPIIIKIIEVEHQKLKNKKNSRSNNNIKRLYRSYSKNFTFYGTRSTQSYSKYFSKKYSPPHNTDPMKMLDNYKKRLAEKYGLKKI